LDRVAFFGVAFFVVEFLAGAFLVVPEVLVAVFRGAAFLAAGLIAEVWQNRFRPGRGGERVEGLRIDAVGPAWPDQVRGRP
jgi:hypothetical protein